MLRLPRDPRWFQIAVLTGLLAHGVLVLDFEIRASIAAVILGTALAVQALADRWAGRPFEPKSALISALSLCLLLRTSSPALAAGAAAIAIGSKPLIRFGGKHVFNPSNLGLVAVVLASERAWISPGQWGSSVLTPFAVAILGWLVVRRAERSDVTWAFLAFWVAALFGRAAWLGDPWTIPLHQLANGSMLLFAFAMISDPKTTPDSRAGRVLFAALVAAGGAWVTFGLHRSEGPIFALVACAPLVPLIDRLLPGPKYRWTAPPAADLIGPSAHLLPQRSAAMTRRASVPTVTALALAVALAAAAPAAAFCGFYVARADTGIFNRASQVVLVRDGDRTVLTMASDFRGAPEEFAVVIPVPTRIEREQIHVAEKALVDHLDAYTAPRLVEYFDEDPCAPRPMYDALQMRAGAPAAAPAGGAERAKALGVTIEAAYTVGEYDILILSATQSGGLVEWLKGEGYKLPPGAEPVVGSYLKQGMRFFVARVNLEEKAKLGTSYLRPLQVAYETPKFMLPIRLGTVNADGPQELFIYTLTRGGRVETTNYRTVHLPTGDEIPPFVKGDFGRFYRDMFARQVAEEDGRAVFLEYAWDMGWCDPCAADPLTADELRELGVFWIESGPESRRAPPQFGGGAQDVFVTRLHVSYDRDHFPEDLRFQETGDRTNFQGRYVLRQPWTGPARCEAGERYRVALAERQGHEAETLARLTGWPLAEIRDRIGRPGEAVPASEEEVPWWRKLWGG